jgi:hypothetical protein
MGDSSTLGFDFVSAHTIDVVTIGAGTIVYANASNSTEPIAIADMEIHMTGIANLSASDFQLY